MQRIVDGLSHDKTCQVWVSLLNRPKSILRGSSPKSRFGGHGSQVYREGGRRPVEVTFLSSIVRRPRSVVLPAAAHTQLWYP